ncbi:MAG: primosomal protein N' [Candidatus Zixiibacteriota bacterium]|nr:MAG: primosomal protein N' [candidate division Zixibacteria bacterium]
MPRFASVAVSGPLKKTFIYRIPHNIEDLRPGQRVLVPFGRMRKAGFFLGPGRPPENLEIKDIIRTIDTVSCFTDELFGFCQWMAGYYFANPADCLTAALPPIYKSRRAAALIWSEQLGGELPAPLRKLYRPGKRVSKATLARINECDRGVLERLMASGSIVERWPQKRSEVGKKMLGFKAGPEDAWAGHFAGRRFRPDPVDGIRSRAELKADGWSDHHIREASKNSVLIPVYSQEPVGLLSFIKPRTDLRNITLNDEQKVAVAGLVEALDRGFRAHLLHGVTGSGKTLVYCHLCEQVLNRGKTALVLTPEIALTSTALAYFRGYFGEGVAVMHSAMTARERLESWRGIREGRYRIVVGPRSAVFAPLPELGVIIVDEEHDGSYKQDNPTPRFQGRDSAIMRAKMNDIPVVLGSASPSVESYHHAVSGRYELLELTQRPGGSQLPTVHIVDMKKDRLGGDVAYISYALKKRLEESLSKSEQAILYLNRRGHSPQLKCGGCGRAPKCPNCEVNLTYHKVGARLSCHYCGHMLKDYDRCSYCQGTEFIYQGVGTQKVEEVIPRLLPEASVVRMDSDSASGRKRAYQILADFAAHKSSLLLGTQMVTKGLDLPDVTLVGVLSADMSLDLPDYRASEKAFARLLQVAGRSGRARSSGTVMIQTFYPEHEVICDAARQDYRGFFDREIQSRKALFYPPFSRIVNFVLTATDEGRLEREAAGFRMRLRDLLTESKIEAQVLGPAPCPMYRLRGRYRRHLFVKTGQMVRLVRALTDWESRLARFGLPSPIRVAVDVDPDDMM